MISWIEIAKELERYAETCKQQVELSSQRIGRMRAFLREEIAPEWRMWQERAAAATGQLLPGFDEPPDAIHPVESASPPGVLLASDGSQIFPSQHEIAPIALIHIALLRLNYADQRDAPLLENHAALLSPEDFNDASDPEQGVRFTDLVSDQRTLEEITRLADMAEQTAARSEGVPCYALTDGSLILWRLAGREERAYEKRATDSFVAQLRRFQQAGVPIAGYISGSNSREVAQLIEFAERETGAPASSAQPITDAAIFHGLLREGERSALFHSRSKILSRYGDQSVSYFFLHVGAEVAKIEVPRWMMQHPNWLDALAAECWLQSRLGGGYPIILAEAHEQAVIRGADREAFYSLLEQTLLRNNVMIKMSPKQLRKRASLL